MTHRWPAPKPTTPPRWVHHPKTRTESGLTEVEWLEAIPPGTWARVPLEPGDDGVQIYRRLERRSRTRGRRWKVRSRDHFRIIWVYREAEDQ